MPPSKKVMATGSSAINGQDRQSRTLKLYNWMYDRMSALASSKQGGICRSIAQIEVVSLLRRANRTPQECIMATNFGSSFDVVEHALAIAEQLQTDPAMHKITDICRPYTLYTMLLEHVQR